MSDTVSMHIHRLRQVKAYTHSYTQTLFNNVTAGGASFRVSLCLLQFTFFMQYWLPRCCLPPLIAKPDFNQCNVMASETRKELLLIKGFNLNHEN